MQRMVHPARNNVPTALGRQPRCPLWVFNWRSARPCPRQRGALRTVATASPAQRLLNGTRSSQQESRSFSDTIVDLPRKPEIASDVGSCRVTRDALWAARSLFAALNRRDVSAVLSLLADDVTYENLGSSTVLRGRAAVGRFYLEALAALPEDAVFELEGSDGRGTDPWVGDEGVPSGPTLQAGVVWRVKLKGLVVPLSRGVGIYWADPRTSRLSCILDNPEHTVKQSVPSLTSAPWGSPLLAGLGPLAMPAAMSVTSFWNSVVPGGGSGGSGGGGGGPSAVGGGLAGTFMAVLGSVLPIQGPSSGNQSISSSSSSSRTGGGGESSSGAVATGGGGGGSGGGGGRRAMLFRDLRGSAESGGGGGGAAGRARAAAAAAAATASAAVSLSAGAPKTQLGTVTLRSRGTSGVGGDGAAVTVPSASGSTGTPASARTAVTAKTIAPRMSAPGMTLRSSSNDSSRERIRMRPLPDPKPPPQSLPGASVSLASSLASLDDDDDTSAALISAATATTSGSRSTTPSSAATAVSKSKPSSVASNGARPVTARNSNGSNGTSGSGGADGSGDGGGGISSLVFASVDSGSDSDTGGSGGLTPAPFPRSTSLEVNLTGLWEKDITASQVEEYESMLDVLELGGLQKVTARLIDGLDLRQDEERFEVSFVTVVPFFRVTEGSRFGSASSMMRRDLRSGRQMVQAARAPGGVVVDMCWEAPLAGSLREEYVVSEDGAAVAVTSTLRIGTQAAVATQVYRRSSRNKSDFLASKRSSYGSLSDVLTSQEQKYGKIEY